MLHDDDCRRGDELVRQIAGGASAGEYELVGLLHRGYPVAQLRELLCSDSVGVLESAARVCSELGRLGSSLIRELTPLITHASPNVRYYAMDAIADVVDPSDTQRLGVLAGALLDVDENMRWLALRLLCAFSPEELRSAEDGAAEPALSERLAWLQSLEKSSRDAPTLEAEIARCLGSGDWATRAVAAVAAVRIAERAPGARALAAELQDPEIKSLLKVMV